MKKSLLLLAAAILSIAACQKKENTDTPSGSSSLELTNVTVSEAVTVPGTIQVAAKVADEKVALSTVEISVALVDGTVIANKSIRTPGNSAEIAETIDIPFYGGMAEGADILVTVEAINVDGATKKQVSKVKLHRPSLPSTLYMIIGDNVYEMTQSLTDNNIYKTEEGEFENAVTATIATSADITEAQFIWGVSTEENLAQICALSDVTGVTVAYPTYVVSAYTFNALTFEVGVEGEELHISVNGTALEPQGTLLYASIDFEKNATVSIEGIGDLDNAWNRDFFSNDSGTLTFLRESGTYDVFYSPKYNYIWIVKTAAVAPECFWIVGHGFTQAPVLHDDVLSGEGWDPEGNITTLGYAVPIGDGKYQCSLYLTAKHIWESFEFEIYSDRAWGKENGFGGTSLSGFTKGVKLSGAADGMPGLTSDSGFQAGYYTLTFDTTTGDINLVRHTEWQDTGTSGIFINGTELEIDLDGGFDYANIEFTNGVEVSFSGITADELNRDFFRIDGGKAYFEGVSGTYKLSYYPGQSYTWLVSESMTFPDCVYILGPGCWSAPVFDNALSWEIDAWTRSAPNLVVAPKIADKTYKATMSMSTDNTQWSVGLEFYSDLEWGQENVAPITITGPAADRFTIEGTVLHGVDEASDPFQPGNYCMIMTAVEGGLSIDITKISSAE